jgi:hypothetical protein
MPFGRTKHHRREQSRLQRRKIKMDIAYPIKVATGYAVARGSGRTSAYKTLSEARNVARAVNRAWRKKNYCYVKFY